MAIKTFISDIFKGKKNKQNVSSEEKAYQAVWMANGRKAEFTDYGEDLLFSDVVQTAIKKIAQEISKLQPKHIRVDKSGTITEPKSDFNRLFKFKPNPLMTTSELLEKMIWALYCKYNCFVYPTYEIVMDGKGAYRRYTGFYPLNPKKVAFLQDAKGELFLKLEFGPSKSFTLPYADMIHIRRQFSLNDYMGGNAEGEADKEAILKVVKTDVTALEGVQKAVPLSMGVMGILKINTLQNEEFLEKERQAFTRSIERNESGFLITDLKSEYIPTNPNPRIIDKETMEFLQTKILSWTGVPLKIYRGDYDENDYQAWYEQELEPLIIRMSQAFSYPLFTENELNHGNEVVFYPRSVMYASTKTKLNIVKTLGEQGLLWDNEKRQLIGYPIIEGEDGNRRTQSLNYISVDIINEYQLRNRGKPEDKSNEGDKKEDPIKEGDKEGTE